MIEVAVSFLKDRLNGHLRRLANNVDGDGTEDKVVFLDGEKMDPITFKLGAVTVVLINIEEENGLRSADRFSRTAADGTRLQVQPELRLELCILFVARFKEYEKSLGYLSKIIQYFQTNRVFDSSVAADLDQRIGRLVLQLMPLPFSQQNDLWNALRTTYHPSVLYKAGLIIVRDSEIRTTATVVEPVVDLSHARPASL